MGVLKQLFNFGNSGLDYDSDPRLVAPGDSTNRVNVSTGEHGREFVISNMKGTTRKQISFDHDGAYDEADYTVIGSLYDDNRDAIYIFIYSDLSNHCILRFNYSDDSFDKIAWDHTGLGFDVDYPIVDPFMIGDFLHWNPRTSSPRVINVQWAYYDFVAYNRSTGTDGNTWSVNDYVSDRNKVFKVLESGIRRDANLYAYPDTSLEFIGWKYNDVDMSPPSGTYEEYVRYREFYNTPIRPFVEVPYTDLGDDTSFDANYIRGNIFQFSYRFYVPGQGYTTSSSFSEIIANHNDEAFDGEVVGDINSNNVIEVGFNIGDNGSNNILNTGAWLWEFAEILFRKNDETSWKLAERIYHDDPNAIKSSATTGGVTSYVFSTSFYNDKKYENVDSASIEKQYNALPVKANAQWALDGERAAYGGVTEGRDNIQENLGITLTSGNRPIGLRSDTYTTAVDTFTFTLSIDNT